MAAPTPLPGATPAARRSRFRGVLAHPWLACCAGQACPLRGRYPRTGGAGRAGFPHQSMPCRIHP
ncbi:MAG: hypothetical protein EOP71_07390 [Variovorax sp.]|nr:MAG: hypothetical protein EOP71_07390 [Variovorax sp.]